MHDARPTEPAVTGLGWRNRVVRTPGRTLVRLSSIGLTALACAHPAQAPPAAEAPITPKPSAASKPETHRVARRAIAKLALGEAVVAVYATAEGQVDVGASAPGGSILLHFVPADVDAWVANTARILAARPRPKRGATVVAPSTLTERDVRAGALTFERRTTRRSVRYSLFFANRDFGGFPVAITRQDALVLIGTLRDAAKAARAAVDTTPPRPDTHTPPSRSRGPSPG